MANVLTYGGVFLAVLASGFDPDYWWHLRAGEWIAAHTAAPRADFLSFSAAGMPWLDHEWLTEAGIWILYHTFGHWAPLVTFAAIVTLAFRLLDLRLRRRGTHFLLRAFLILAGLLAAGGSIGVRAQMITLAMLAALLLLIDRWNDAPLSRTVVAIPCLFLLWCNLHGGFAIGLGILGLVLISRVVDRIRRRQDSAAVRSAAVVLGASLIASLFNPYGVRALFYPFRFLRSNPFTSRILESAAPGFNEPVSLAFAFLLLLFVASLVWNRGRIATSDLLVSTALTWLAMTQVRNISVWVVAVVPVLGESVQAAIERIRDRFGVPPQRFIDPARAASLNRILLSVVVVAYVGLATAYLGPERFSSLEEKHFPLAAVRQLREEGARRIVADYPWGGYVLWKLRPSGRVFIDGRADTVYTEAILDSYVTIVSARDGWQEELDRWRVDAILVPPEAPIVRSAAQSGRWRVSFADDRSVVLSRR